MIPPTVRELIALRIDEIVELIGLVGLNLFESYFNAVVKTDVDRFPHLLPAPPNG